jgi:hypothetical protein
MMIAVGRDASIDRKRRPRLPVSQILSFDEFSEFGAELTDQDSERDARLQRRQRRINIDRSIHN